MPSTGAVGHNWLVRRMSEIGKEGVHGAVVIWVALDDAVEILSKQTSETAQQLAQHRYGDQAAEFAEDALHTATNVVQIKGKLTRSTTRDLARRASKFALVALDQKAEEDVKENK